jgi:hypothetical protein
MRINRRHFVQTGIAGSLAGLFGTQLPASASRAAPLHAVVFDDRFAAAVRFGNAARSRGLSTRGVRGDVTDLWYRELQPLWKVRAAPLAGLTAYGALFCLEQLAWDHRMRVIYHGVHETRPDEEDVTAGTADWPADVAAWIAAVDSRGAWTGFAPARRTTARRYPTPGPAFAATLHSWVIAPARA